jgi:hypothetical protein
MAAVEPGQDPRRARRAEQRRRAVRRRRMAAGVVIAVLAVAAAVAIVRVTGSSSEATAQAPGQAPPPGTGTGTTPAPAPTPAPTARNAKPVRVTAVGDIVMGSLPYGLPPDGGRSFFSGVDQYLVGDVVLGNLEGTLATGGASKCGGGSPNCFAFRTPPSYARWLKGAGFTVMNLANNHAYDYGASAERETVAALNRVGLLNTGRPGTQATQTVGGQRVAVLGFAPYKWADSLTDIARAKRRVREAAANAEIVVVTFHGGAEGSDRTHVPSGTETFLGENRGDLRRFTHAVVDAGADFVVGSGPHVLRGMEVYRGRLIAYSMGNFGGYKVFGLGGVLSTSGVLQVTLSPDGRFRSGRFRPTQLVGSGTPATGGYGISQVQSLSRQDFGARAARIDAGGGISAPR